MDSKPYREHMWALLDGVLRDIGPRESCSENEKRLGRRLAEEWKRLGLDVAIEPFSCNPRAFLGFIPFTALLYLVATIAYWVYPFLSFLLGAAACTMIWFELLRYREFLDPLFPESRGENVVAVLAPTGPVQRRVVVSAHQDSAYEFNLWYFLKNAAILVMAVGFVALVFLTVGSLAKSLAGAGTESRAFNVIGFVAIGLYPFVGLNFFFHTYSVVPGAMDDLAGICVLHGAAHAVRDAKSVGLGLRNTEVVLLAASSEEAGLRGAKRYAEAHRGEMTAIPTFGLFVDGVYDEQYLTVVRREVFTGADHDPRLVQLAKDVAANRGWPIREHVIPLGATDATAFSLAGIPSVALLCQDSTRLVPNYHTRLDTIDHVRPESMEVMLQLVLDMVGQIDERGL